MPLLKDSPCPSCSAPLQAIAVWARAPKYKYLFLVGTTGIRCAACGKRWVIAPGRLVASIIVAPALIIAAALVLTVGLGLESRLMQLADWNWIIWLPIYIVLGTVLVLRFGSYLLRLVPAREGEPVQYPLDEA